MNLAEVVIREVKRNCSFEIHQLFVERTCPPGESAARHSNGVVLFLDV